MFSKKAAEPFQTPPPQPTGGNHATENPPGRNSIQAADVRHGRYEGRRRREARKRAVGLAGLNQNAMVAHDMRVVACRRAGVLHLDKVGGWPLGGIRRCEWDALVRIRAAACRAGRLGGSDGRSRAVGQANRNIAGDIAAVEQRNPGNGAIGRNEDFLHIGFSGGRRRVIAVRGGGGRILARVKTSRRETEPTCGSHTARRRQSAGNGRGGQREGSQELRKGHAVMKRQRAGRLENRNLDIAAAGRQPGAFGCRDKR